MNKVIDTKINLCNSCLNHFAECKTSDKDIEWGDGVGNDNIIKCKNYMEVVK